VDCSFSKHLQWFRLHNLLPRTSMHETSPRSVGKVKQAPIDMANDICGSAGNAVKPDGGVCSGVELA